MIHPARTWSLSVLSLFALSGCFFPGGGGRTPDPMNTPRTPPAACTATPAALTLCQGGAACPVQSESVIACAQAIEAAVVAAGPGGSSALALATRGTNDADFHAQLALLDAAGGGSFRVDPVAPGRSTTTSNPAPYVAAAFDPNNAPAWVTTLGDETLAVRGEGTSEHLADPQSNGAGDPAVLAVAFEPDGTQDVLARSYTQLWLFQRTPAGAWSSQAIDGDASQPAAMAVGADGVRYIATMRSNGQPSWDLYVAHGAGDGVLAGAVAYGTRALSVLAVRGARGASVPVVLASGDGQPRVFVGDGQGGFAQQEYVPPGGGLNDTCPYTATLGDCSCPSTCARDGQVALDATLLRAADGSALIATVVAEVHESLTVTRHSTESNLGTLTCSCDATTRSRSVAAARLAFATIAADGTAHDVGALPVPGSTVAIQGSERDGLDVLILRDSEQPNALRRVVIDPAQLR